MYPKTTAQPHELWRVYRVAKLLDISKKRVYQMVEEGKLHAVRLGPRSMRITLESIDRFIAENSKKVAFAK